jgi:hypothetical protein
MSDDPNALDASLIDRMRELARQGKSVSEIIDDLRSSLGMDRGFSVLILRYFMRAFKLTLREAREIEGYSSMGGGAISNEDLDALLRPLIMERLPRS